MEITSLQTVYEYEGVRLSPPAGMALPEDVRAFFARLYPALINATIDGPRVEGHELVYTFRPAVGTKG